MVIYCCYNMYIYWIILKIRDLDRDFLIKRERERKRLLFNFIM